MTENIDARTVAGFGDEWSRFDQNELSELELKSVFDDYFHIFPWEQINGSSEGFDLGSGSGRWAKLVAPRVGKLHCVDASLDALAVARKNLSGNRNCEFHHSSVDKMPFEDNSMDFGYSLGVLHHVPNTPAGLKACVSKLKPGAPFLLYLYYAFDNRPLWFRAIWKSSDAVRQVVSRCPHGLRYWLSQGLAVSVYYPLALGSRVAEKAGLDVSRIPLSYYRNRSFYTMRTDALDRFGTRLEQRFTAVEIEAMMKDAGLENITFSRRAPYWCAVGIKRA